jgi:hypothetical protein
MTRWKNTVELGRPQMTIWHKHIACWILKVTNTHSDYVIKVKFTLEKAMKAQTGEEV